jgi:hypothetical protein
VAAAPDVLVSPVELLPAVPVLVSPVELLPAVPVLVSPVELLPAALLDLPVSLDIGVLGAVEVQAASAKTHAKGVIHFIIESSLKD